MTILAPDRPDVKAPTGREVRAYLRRQAERLSASGSPLAACVAVLLRRAEDDLMAACTGDGRASAEDLESRLAKLDSLAEERLDEQYERGYADGLRAVNFEGMTF